MDFFSGRRGEGDFVCDRLAGGGGEGAMDGKDSVEDVSETDRSLLVIVPFATLLLRYDVKKLWIDGWMEKVDGCERYVCIGILDSS